jgi:acetoin:2,6-dichlorophenolindophenol oxidoreductase subunit beta
MRQLTFAEALREAMTQEMERDPGVFLMGEDVGGFGGPFGITKGMVEQFGTQRVRDTPVSEAGFFGMAVGAAMLGKRPIVEVHYADFLTCAMDALVNQAAKMHLMSGGQFSVPMVVRAPTGSTNRGATHGQSLEAWFMHTAGLKVVCPSNPYDAKGLLIASIRDNNPVLFFEHRYLYGTRSPGGKVHSAWEALSSAGSDVPEEPYALPLGQARVVRPGRDISVVATMLMVHKAMAAAEELSKEGIELEVIDPCTLAPLDQETIFSSVRKTSRLLVASEDALTAGVSAEIAALVCETAFAYLDAPPVRVAGRNSPIPFAPNAEEAVLPGIADITAAARQLMGTGREFDDLRYPK